MIRISEAFDLSFIDEAVDFVDEIETIGNDILEDVAGEIEKPLLNELSSDAPPVKYPIDWTSERQRKAFFATDGFGSGIPYRRTNKLRNAWIIEIRDGAIVVENPSDTAKFVYGSLAQNRSAALRFQQRFHANTGWQAATDTVAFWLDAAEELYIEKFDKRVADLASAKGRRRAYTKGRRR